jgi:hypothetical protein
VLIDLHHGALGHVGLLNLPHGLVLIGVEGSTHRVDALHAFLAEDVEHLLYDHHYALNELHALATRFDMPERSLEVIERREHLGDHALSGAPGSILGVARNPLPVVVEVGLQPSRGVEVRRGLLPRTLELTFEHVASEFVLSTEVFAQFRIQRGLVQSRGLTCLGVDTGGAG